MLPARQSSSLLLHHSSLVNFISNRAETDTLSRIFTNTYARTAACFFLLSSCDLLKSSSEKGTCYLRPPAVDWPSKIISNCNTKKGYDSHWALFQNKSITDPLPKIYLTTSVDVLNNLYWSYSVFISVPQTESWNSWVTINFQIYGFFGPLRIGLLLLEVCSWPSNKP